MKDRIKQLIITYEAMLSKTRSKIRRECLENFIDDLKQAFRDAQ